MDQSIRERLFARSGSKKKLSGKENLISWLKTIGTAVVLALLIKNFIIVNASVLSGSMETAIMTGDRVICSRLTYLGSNPQRFDIIAFDYTEGNQKLVYVKRIIGLPGETVEVVDGKVYLNGSDTPLTDDFLDPQANGVPQGSWGPFVVPEGEYFVMGDNRNFSYDSRRWPYPYVSRGDILGKALLVYFPRVELVAKVAE